MYLPTLGLLLTSLALSNAAALGRRTWSDSNIHVRDDWSPVNTTFTCLFLTNEPNWAGETQNLCQIGGVCASQIPDGLAANVSLAGPSDGKCQTCFLYSEIGCAGDRSAPLVYPGVADLNTIGFDKQTMSWRCWKMCGYIVESSSAAETSTVQPSIGTLSNSTTTSPSFAFSPTSTNVELIKARDVTTTLSSTDVPASITTTLSGPQPAVSITTTVTGGADTTPAKTSTSSASDSTIPLPSDFTPPAPFSTSTTALSAANATPTGPTMVETTSFAVASSSPSESSTINTNTPGFSMSPSPVTVTHTFADGSKMTETTTLLEPVPTVPSAPPKM